MNEGLEVKKRIVFLGTPAVVVPVLDLLLASHQSWEVVGVVSQPPTRAPRGQAIVVSPVHQRALEMDKPVLTPVDAKAPEFISSLREWNPDLCVTAAYGQVLSEEFLALPRFGTLNIHPSLLPLYRGAAPVQRAVEDGVPVTGVTIAQTVRAMDAGPIVAQETFAVDEAIRAPELLSQLFLLGARRLVDILPDYFSGQLSMREQEHQRATKARKLTMEEGLLHPEQQSASVMHNKVRAFWGWPGTRLKIAIEGEPVEVKVLSTRLSPALRAKTRDIIFDGETLELVCGDGSVLQLIDLQAPGKRPLSARDFWNGLRTKKIFWV
jgi:methionyl-tRNA formyltransferase